MFQITADFFDNRERSNGRRAAVKGPRIVLAAGGTGGHIMPALATAEAFRRMACGVECLFICGRKEVERAIYREAGHKPIVLPLDRVPGTPAGRLKRYRQMIESVWKARRALRRVRPDAVIAFGGYTAAPVIVAAWGMGVPIYLQEQNAVPGRVNRLFSLFARRVFIGCPYARRYFADRKIINTGTPVRQSCLCRTRAAARVHFGIAEDEWTLLVIGGSQGAQGVNRLVFEVLERLSASGGAGRPLCVLWSTGAGEYEDVCGALEKTFTPAGLQDASGRRVLSWNAGAGTMRAVVRPFIGEMGLAYAAADMAVSRAGAGTVAELLANSVPAVLIPYPHAADDHQRRNAMLPHDEGAACIVDERHPNAAAQIEAVVRELMADAATAAAMRRAAGRLAQPDAADQIARLVLDDLAGRSGAVFSSLNQPQTQGALKG
ncbi:MAG: undecaprenyldiphospho-muramoylpentapeptide beta-N-acetylglucosaminyltransferase [Candidatus Sumerlaeia bacterium]